MAIAHPVVVDVDEEGAWLVRVEGMVLSDVLGEGPDPFTVEIEYDVALDVTD